MNRRSFLKALTAVAASINVPLLLADDNLLMPKDKKIAIPEKTIILSKYDNNDGLRGYITYKFHKDEMEMQVVLIAKLKAAGFRINNFADSAYNPNTGMLTIGQWVSLK